MSTRTFAMSTPAGPIDLSRGKSDRGLLPVPRPSGPASRRTSGHRSSTWRTIGPVVKYLQAKRHRNVHPRAPVTGRVGRTSRATAAYGAASFSAMGCCPVFGMRPLLHLCPNTPLKNAGMRMDPARPHGSVTTEWHTRTRAWCHYSTYHQRHYPRRLAHHTPPQALPHHRWTLRQCVPWSTCACAHHSRYQATRSEAQPANETHGFDVRPYTCACSVSVARLGHSDRT